MNSELIATGMFLLLVCSSLTSLIVEGLKKVIEITKPNVAAGIVAIIIGGAVSTGWILLNHMALDAATILFTAALIVLSWLCAMVGYDKVIQTLQQLIGGMGNKKDE